MKLTIVLTVYNKESFLKRSLEALLSQDCDSDYELLAINDGSSDNSLDILFDYASRDARIRVISQDNQGLSMARNNGLEAASGEYVWFVDADDTVAPNAVSNILNAMKERPDIIPIYAQTEGSETIRNAVDKESKTGRDIIISEKWEDCGVFNVFKKSFLIENDLRFFPGLYHEDADFTPRMLYMAKTVKVVPEVLYKVYRDPNSITQIPRSKRAFDHLTIALRLYDFLAEKGEINTPIGRSVFLKMSVDINMALWVIVQNNKEEQKKFNRSFYDNKKHLLQILRLSPHIKYRFESFLISLFPYRPVTVYKCLKVFG